ncbi:hypothetical protein EV401DRAFT_1897208 [Pisolithus croceorrhizus]|nr:hypothetical protein EV401DRAFT_1897208 [Pisolithus croceorrhizus]
MYSWVFIPIHWAISLPPANTLGVTAVYGGKAVASTATIDVHDSRKWLGRRDSPGSYTVAKCYTADVGQELAYCSLNYERGKDRTVALLSYDSNSTRRGACRIPLIKTPPYSAGHLYRWNGRQDLSRKLHRDRVLTDKITVITFLGNLRCASQWQLLLADDGTEAAPITSAGRTDTTGPLGVNDIMTMTVLREVTGGFFGQQGLIMKTSRDIRIMNHGRIIVSHLVICLGKSLDDHEGLELGIVLEENPELL